jgi:hypothetical protein
MKKIILLFLLVVTAIGRAQVGVNTTNPHASSILDISATNKGVLVPRVSLANVTTTMLDGTNTAATGLLIWNTNAATVGGNGIGFYFFNGTQWMPITQTSTADHDIYEVGSTNPPNAITDNKFTQGSLNIGSSTAANGVLDIDNATKTTSLNVSNTYTANPVGIDVDLNTTSGGKTGINIAQSGTFAGYGGVGAMIKTSDNCSGNYNRFVMYNVLNGSSTDPSLSAFGIRNAFTGNTFVGDYTGIANLDFTTTNGNRYGTYNNFNGTGNGINYGLYNSLSGTGSGNKYGVFNAIPATAGGTHYGIYSDVLKTGSYAGYFLGNVAIGTSALNHYILPASRGTNGQIMRTDGSGNVSWANNVTSDADWFEVGGTTPANAITDNIYTSGDVSVGKTTAATGKFDISNSTKLNTLVLENTTTSAGIKSGISNSITTQSTNNASSAIFNTISGTALSKYGVSNYFSNLNPSGMMFEYANSNFFGSTGNTSGFGSINYFSPTAANSGQAVGLRNEIMGNNSSGTFVGVENEVNNNTNGFQIGTDNLFNGGGNGGRYGTNNSFFGTANGEVVGTQTNIQIAAAGTGFKYGEKIIINPAAGGTHYGVYADVTKAGSYAGYFLGNVAVGTSGLNTYTFPASRGTNGQIMQTDGVGNVSWVNNTTSDADWFEVGGLTPANSILDNIFTGGDVSIGKATAATGKVDIEADNKIVTLVLDNNNATTGLKTGIENNITLNTNNPFSAGITNNVSGDSGFKFGVTNHFNVNNTGPTITELGYNTDFASTGNVNFIGNHNFVIPSSNNTGTITGYLNTVGNAAIGAFTGLANDHSVTSNSLKRGILNSFTGGGTGDYNGLTNSFTGNANGEFIGINTTINSAGTGLKYGEKIVIDNTSGGIHCGIYADVTKANSYAGYFLGRVSLGTTAGNSYIMPSSRGTNGQIMQTDGVGNVSWTNAPTSDADWFEVGGTTPANAITDNIYTSGDVSIGKITAATAKVDIDANTKLNTLSLENVGVAVGTKNGISNSVLAAASNNASSGILNAMSGLAVNKYGVNNGFVTNNFGANIAETGVNNNFLSEGNVSAIGVNNNFAPISINNSVFTGFKNSLSSNNSTNQFVGLANYISNATNNQQYGVLNAFSGGGTGVRYGIRNDLSGNPTGDIHGIYTDITSVGIGNKYGEWITIANTAPGTHYGIYADVTKSNSYAGYFLGKVAVGTTVADNYTLPASRGTANQIMQTDGLGNVSWANDNRWGLTGNAGTVSGTNFIGTTDAQDLDFRVNNVVKIRLTQKGQMSFVNSGGSVFVGINAGDSDDLTSNQNTFVGATSGQLTDTGNLNTAIGHASLNINTSGQGNSGLGKSSLLTNTSGSNNTGLGRLADVGTFALSNATAVGFNATVSTSDKVRLGSATVTVVEGQVPYTNPSDARFKFNVQDNVPGLDFIAKLKPVTYNFDTQKFSDHVNKNRNKSEVATEDFTLSTAIVRTGFLAQDVEKICKDLGYNFDGLHIPDAANPTDNYGLAYSQFIMPIVKAVQEQQLLIENQKNEIDLLKTALEKYKNLEDRLKALEAR